MPFCARIQTRSTRRLYAGSVSDGSLEFGAPAKMKVQGMNQE